MFDRGTGDMLDAARDRIEEQDDGRKKAYANMALILIEQTIKKGILVMCTVGYSKQEAMRIIAAYVDVIHDEYREENKQ